MNSLGILLSSVVMTYPRKIMTYPDEEYRHTSWTAAALQEAGGRQLSAGGRHPSSERRFFEDKGGTYNQSAGGRHLASEGRCIEENGGTY